MLKVLNIALRSLIAACYMLLVFFPNIHKNHLFDSIIKGLCLFIIIVSGINFFNTLISNETIDIKLGRYQMKIVNWGNFVILFMTIAFYHIYKNNFTNLGYFIACIGIFMISSLRIVINILSR